VPAPYWVSYPDIVAINGGTPVIVSCGPEDGFKLTPQSLEAAITPKTRWVIINSPSNPTGAVYSTEEWRGLITVLLAHPHVAVMTDEIYEHITYDGVKNITALALEPSLRDRFVVVNGMSKAYAMTGWRLGFAAGPRPVIQAVVKLLGQSTTCPCSFAQTAAIEALTNGQGPIKDMLTSYSKRRSLIVDGLKKIDGITCQNPDGAFYAFPDVRPLLGATRPDGVVIETDRDLVAYLLEAASAAVMDGSPGFLRLSFAASEETILDGLASIAQAIAALRIPETAA
jgi:aspartate aminotransferase